jgi:riboflavin synthase
MKKGNDLSCHMFTGIIETTGRVRDLVSNGSNKTFWIQSKISSQLRVDQSISHSGICLTIEEIKADCHRVTAIDETLQKSTINNWEVGSLINLERSLQISDRIEGHLVQGHVDAKAVCIKKKERSGSWEFDFEFPKQFAPLIIEKGSVSVNGISLTAFNVKRKSFRVAVIPYTFEHTNIKEVNKGSKVNLEFDMIGKYIIRTRGLQWKC